MYFQFDEQKFFKRKYTDYLPSVEIVPSSGHNDILQHYLQI